LRNGLRRNLPEKKKKNGKKRGHPQRENGGDCGPGKKYRIVQKRRRGEKKEYLGRKRKGKKERRSERKNKQVKEISILIIAH